MIRRIAVAAALLSTSASAQEFDWHALANQKHMNGAFQYSAKGCAALFGFTVISPLPESTMLDKLDAYLLLRSTPEADVETWAMDIVHPISGVLDEKNSPEADADSKSAAAAAVAASEDPSTFDEAREKYVSGAMAPFQRALSACTAATRDPFLGKYHLAGTGSADSIEKEFRDGFADFVAELNKPKSTRKSAKAAHR